MVNSKYICPKCNNTVCEIDELVRTGGFWNKLVTFRQKRFTTVTCSKCKYTEIYKDPYSIQWGSFSVFSRANY